MTKLLQGGAKRNHVVLDRKTKLKNHPHHQCLHHRLSSAGSAFRVAASAIALCLSCCFLLVQFWPEAAALEDVFQSDRKLHFGKSMLDAKEAREQDEYIHQRLHSGEKSWDGLSWKELKQRKGCDDLPQPRPIPDAKTWTLARKAYLAVVGEEQSTIGTNPSIEENGFRVAYEAKQTTDGKGRGIFAAQAIPKGQTVYDFSSTAQFRNGRDWQEFLRILPNDLACDFMMWSCVVKLGKGAQRLRGFALRIHTDLDGGGMFNDDGDYASGATNSTQTAANVGLVGQTYTTIDGTPNGVRKQAPLVALRDIQIGEEIICDYDEFIAQGAAGISNPWGIFGIK